MPKKIFIWLFIFAVGVVACNDRPDDVLSESETVDLLADLQIADAYVQMRGPNGRDVSPDQVTNGVLLAHNVTKEQLEATMAYYGKNIDDYSRLLEKVYKKIDQKKIKLTGIEKGETEGNDIWPYSPFAYIGSNSANSGLKFSFGAEGITPGENLEWKMRVHEGNVMDMLFGVEYDNGSSSIVKKSSGTRSVSLTLQTDTALKPVRVFGYMNVDHFSTPVWVDSIALVRTPFDSLQYSNIHRQELIRKPAKRVPVKKEEPVKDTIPEKKDTVAPNRIVVPSLM